MVKSCSIVIPCFNESGAIEATIRDILSTLESNRVTTTEVVVINDGSTDGSKETLDQLSKELSEQPFRVIHHSRNLGYGAALKTGIRRSNAEIICITDADGTYPNQRIPELLTLAENHDMVVGARTGDDVDYSKIRSIPKLILVPWVSFLCGTTVPDMNSGMRVFSRDIAMNFLNLLPDGFSFTTTITICLLRNRYDVLFTPISYTKRIGKSHIKPIRDTIRFTQLIARTGMYFAPMRLLTPAVVLFGILFIISGLHDIFILENITDKTILFAFSTINILMFALLADMIDKRSSH
jgi:glycosyltransferase involved in cell wall biosynthesis